MLCYSCYHHRPKFISTQDERDARYCSQRQLRHAWLDNKLLVFLMHSADNNQTIIHTINERKFKHKSAFFPLCQFGQFCLKNVSFTRTYRAAKLTATRLLSVCHMTVVCVLQMQRTCPFAHSTVERDVWLMERDTDMAREDFIFEFYRHKEEAMRGGHLPPQPSQQATSRHGNAPAAPSPAVSRT